MAVLWNTADKTANCVLSGGSLIATINSASYGGVRADTSAASGKIYYEVTPLAGISLNISVGWANATASLSTYTGQDKNSWCCFFYTASTNIWFNNGSIGTTNVAAPAGSTVRVAFDITNLLLWVAVNGNYWNNNPSADPATGVGGLSVSTMNAGPYFPCFNSNVNGASVQANFGALNFNYAMPSGFTSLDTNSQNFNESAKFLGYAIAGPPTNAALSAKFLGYGIVGQPFAAQAAKFLGYGIIGPPNAAQSAKFLAYAILQTIQPPFNPSPDPRRRKLFRRITDQGMNLCLLSPSGSDDEPIINIIW